MTHESEASFQTRVRDYCIGQFGPGNVEPQRYLDATGRYVDLWVETPLLDFAVEIENDFESVPAGVGQALLYAAHAHDAVPVVVVPPAHVDQPEADLLRQTLPVIELDV